MSVRIEIKKLMMSVRNPSKNERIVLSMLVIASIA